MVHTTLPIVCEHCQSVDVMEFPKPLSIKPTPHICSEDLSSLQKGNCKREGKGAANIPHKIRAC